MVNSTLQQIQEADENLNKELEKKDNLEKLKTYDGEDRVTWVGEVYDEAKKEGELSLFKANSGFKSLDEFTGGFYAGDLVVIGGYPNHGKTPFMMNLIYNMVEKDDVKSVFFSYEVPIKRILMKIDIDKNPNALSYYVPRKNSQRDFLWLKKRIMEAKLKYDVRAVFIDHLDYIIKIKSGETEEQSIREAVKSLKEFAMDQEVIMFVAAHVKRTDNILKAPQMNEFKGSAAIEGYADTCLMIHKIPDTKDTGGVLRDSEGDPKYDMHRSKVYVRKSREMGGGHSVKFIHNVNTKLFTELELNRQENGPSFEQAGYIPD